MTCRRAHGPSGPFAEQVDLRPMRVLTVVVLASLAAGCGGGKAATAPASTTATQKDRFAGAELVPPRTSPPLALTDQQGRRVTLKEQRGRYTLVTFIYTHCPDVCPLITSNLNT